MTREEFRDVVSRDEDEALKARSAEDLTEVYDFVSFFFRLIVTVYVYFRLLRSCATRR